MRHQLVRFLFAGCVGFLVDTTVLYLTLWLGFGYFVGRAISFLCAVWATWQLNRRYTFSSARNESVWAEWTRYLAAMSVGGAVNYAAYSVVVSALRPAPWLPILAVAAGSIAGLAVNFATAKWWVFKHARSIPDERQ
ncbi:MAG: GtrA family protein [Trinickia sp.]|jgi:putative flippase GtrA|uniref:GtrA family protein n=1 Tax=Trinickia sp. TaxID=2571163 RepID=UPI003F7F9101